MSHWGVQLVIGKLVTDERVRLLFETRGRECLVDLCRRGIDLDEAEIDALVDIDPQVWSKMARQINCRLWVVERKALAEGQLIHKPLTRREQQVLRGVFEGLTNKQIASELRVSEGRRQSDGAAALSKDARSYARPARTIRRRGLAWDHIGK
jgi:hypothetical protein